MDENPYTPPQTREATPAARRRAMIRRALRGAVEGALVGLLILAVRIIRFFFRGGTLAALREQPWQALGTALLVTAASAIVFALGRGWTGRVAGTFVGAALGAAVGAAAGSFLSYQFGMGDVVQVDAMTLTVMPIGLLIGAALGFVFGAIAGTLAERKLRRWK